MIITPNKNNKFVESLSSDRLFITDGTSLNYQRTLDAILGRPRSRRSNNILTNAIQAFAISNTDPEDEDEDEDEEENDDDEEPF